MKLRAVLELGTLSVWVKMNERGGTTAGLWHRC